MGGLLEWGVWLGTGLPVLLLLLLPALVGRALLRSSWQRGQPLLHPFPVGRGILASPLDLAFYHCLGAQHGGRVYRAYKRLLRWWTGSGEVERCLVMLERTRWSADAMLAFDACITNSQQLRLVRRLVEATELMQLWEAVDGICRMKRLGHLLPAPPDPSLFVDGVDPFLPPKKKGEEGEEGVGEQVEGAEGPLALPTVASTAGTPRRRASDVAGLTQVARQRAAARQREGQMPDTLRPGTLLVPSPILSSMSGEGGSRRSPSEDGLVSTPSIGPAGSDPGAGRGGAAPSPIHLPASALDVEDEASEAPALPSTASEPTDTDTEDMEGLENNALLLAPPPSTPSMGTLRRAIFRMNTLHRLAAQITARAKTKYDPLNKGHERRLLELWDTMMPGQPLEARISDQWQAIGFQGKDPATDFRGMGILALEQLLHLAKRHPATTARLLALSHHPSHWFPLAITGISLSQWCLSLLQTRRLNALVYGYPRGGREAFDEYYCYAFHAFGAMWAERALTILDFPLAFQGFQERMTRQLAEQGWCPPLLEDG